jgi:hypothetical protein
LEHLLCLTATGRKIPQRLVFFLKDRMADIIIENRNGGRQQSQRDDISDLHRFGACLKSDVFSTTIAFPRDCQRGKGFCKNLWLGQPQLNCTMIFTKYKPFMHHFQNFDHLWRIH